MNKCYKVIWDQVKQIFIAVSELSANKGKKSSSKSRNLVKIALPKTISIFLLAIPLQLQAEGKGSPKQTKLTSPVVDSKEFNQTSYGKGATVTHKWGTALGAKSNAGDAAVGLGHMAKATGEDSISIGYSSKAENYRSVAIGGSSKATADNTVAVGNNASASGAQSTAVGNKSESRGRNSLALGANASAKELNSLAIGTFSQVNGKDAASFGSGAKAIGTNSLSLGTYSKASADSAIAIGRSASSLVPDGVAIGTNSVANTFAGATPYIVSKASGEDRERVLNTKGTGGGVSFGRNKEAHGEEIYRQLTNVAAGSYDTDAVNVAQLRSVESLVTKKGQFESLFVSDNSENSLNFVGENGLTLTDKEGNRLNLTASGIEAKDAEGNDVEARLVTLSGDTGTAKTGTRFAVHGGKTAQFAAAQSGFSGENVATHIGPEGVLSVGIAKAPHFDRLGVGDAGSAGAITLDPVAGISVAGRDGGEGLSLSGEQGMAVRGAAGQTLYGSDGLGIRGPAGEDGKPGTLLASLTGRDGLMINGESGRVSLNGQDGLSITGPSGADGRPGLTTTVTADGGVSTRDAEGNDVEARLVTLSGDTGTAKTGTRFAVHGGKTAQFAAAQSGFSGENVATHIGPEGVLSVGIAKAPHFDRLGVGDAGSAGAITLDPVAGISVAGRDGGEGLSLSGEQGMAVRGAAGQTLYGSDGLGIRGPAGEDGKPGTLLASLTGRDGLMINGESGRVSLNGQDGLSITGPSGADGRPGLTTTVTADGGVSTRDAEGNDVEARLVTLSGDTGTAKTGTRFAVHGGKTAQFAAAQSGFSGENVATHIGPEGVLSVGIAKAPHFDRLGVGDAGSAGAITLDPVAGISVAGRDGGEGLSLSGEQGMAVRGAAGQTLYGSDGLGIRGPAGEDGKPGTLLASLTGRDGLMINGESGRVSLNGQDGLSITGPSGADGRPGLTTTVTADGGVSTRDAEGNDVEARLVTLSGDTGTAKTGTRFAVHGGKTAQFAAAQSGFSGENVATHIGPEGVLSVGIAKAPHFDRLGVGDAGSAGAITLDPVAGISVAGRDGGEGLSLSGEQGMAVRGAAGQTLYGSDGLGIRGPAGEDGKPGTLLASLTGRDGLMINGESGRVSLNGQDGLSITGPSGADGRPGLTTTVTADGGVSTRDAEGNDVEARLVTLSGDTGTAKTGTRFAVHGGKTAQFAAAQSGFSGENVATHIGPEGVLSVGIAKAPHFDRLGVGDAGSAGAITLDPVAGISVAGRDGGEGLSLSGEQGMAVRGAAGQTLYGSDGLGIRGPAGEDGKPGTLLASLTGRDGLMINGESGRVSLNGQDGLSITGPSGADGRPGLTTTVTADGGVSTRDAEGNDVEARLVTLSGDTGTAKTGTRFAVHGGKTAQFAAAQSGFSGENVATHIGPEGVLSVGIAKAPHFDRLGVGDAGSAGAITLDPVAGISVAGRDGGEGLSLSGEQGMAVRGAAGQTLYGSDGLGIRGPAGEDGKPGTLLASLTGRDGLMINGESGRVSLNGQDGLSITGPSGADGRPGLTTTVTADGGVSTRDAEGNDVEARLVTLSGDTGTAKTGTRFAVHGGKTAQFAAAQSGFSGENVATHIGPEGVLSVGIAKAPHFDRLGVGDAGSAGAITLDPVAGISVAGRDGGEGLSLSGEQGMAVRGAAGQTLYGSDGLGIRGPAGEDGKPGTLLASLTGRDGLMINGESGRVSLNGQDGLSITGPSGADGRPGLTTTVTADGGVSTRDAEGNDVEARLVTLSGDTGTAKTGTRFAVHGGKTAQFAAAQSGFSGENVATHIGPEGVLSVGIAKAPHFDRLGVGDAGSAGAITLDPVAGISVAGRDGGEGLSLSGEQGMAVRGAAGQTLYGSDGLGIRGPAGEDGKPGTLLASLTGRDGLMINGESGRVSLNGQDGLSITGPSGADGRPGLTTTVTADGGVSTRDAEGNDVEARLVTLSGDTGTAKTGTRFAVHGGKTAQFAAAQSGFSGENVATHIGPEGVLSVGIAKAPHFDRLGVGDAGSAGAITLDPVAGISVAGRDGGEGLSLSGEQGMAVRGAAGQTLYGSDGLGIRGPAGEDGKPGTLLASLTGRDGLMINGESGRVSLNGQDGLSITGPSGADGRPGLTTTVTADGGVSTRDAEGNDVEARLVTLSGDTGTAKTGTRFAVHGGKTAQFAAAQSGFSGENVATHIGPEGVLSVGIAKAPHFDRLGVGDAGSAGAITLDPVAGISVAGRDGGEGLSLSGEQGIKMGNVKITQDSITVNNSKVLTTGTFIDALTKNNDIVTSAFDFKLDKNRIKAVYESRQYTDEKVNALSKEYKKPLNKGKEIIKYKGAYKEALAKGNDSLAIGSSAKSIGRESTTIGTNAKALGSNSVAIGNNSLANRENVISVGSSDNKRQITNVAPGTKETDAVNMGQLKAQSSRFENNYKKVFKEVNKNSKAIHELDKKVNKGFASQAALNGLMQPYGIRKINFSAAVGGYEMEHAVAIGAGYRFNDNIAIKSGFSTNAGSLKGTSYNVGISMEW